ncbi:TonB-dependent receptor [bacterium]|nr:TonB-dependent receptor [bacterium]MBU1884764.1 TonB-dependent receptor [bacterium]
MSRIKAVYLFLLQFLLASSLSASQDNTTIVDATMIPLEELLQTEYIPANHIANQISNAASAVSIVTAKDIGDYGYRTLGDILGSMRGIQIFHDYEYTYIGGRGFSAPGEYAGRIIVLIDGYRADDSMYGQAYLGNDSLLDVSLIDRVEYIPGGGSSGYGNGALLGVINIITKKGKDIDAVQVAGGYGSHNSRTKRATYGKKLENGLDILFSASDYISDGRDFTYQVNAVDTTQKDQNGERNQRFFLKTSYENFSLLAARSTRDLHIPSYPQDGIISDKSPMIQDENAFIRLSANIDLSQDLKLSASVWYGHYLYRYDDPVYFENWGITELYGTNARWHGGDLKFISSWFENHTFSLGFEYRNDYEWSSFDKYRNDTTGQIEESYPYDYEPRKTTSVYLYDDFSIFPDFNLNYGFRYEQSNNNGFHSFSPQAALIYKAFKNTVFKFSTGMTNRQATISEGYVDKPEHAQTTELVWEQGLGWQTELLASAYQYRISDRISFDTSDILARGAEVEFKKHWNDGTRVHASYAYQDAYDVDTKLPLINAPHDIAKLNLSTPLVDEKLRMGFEMQYLGKRVLSTDARNTYADSYTIANVNLISRNAIPNTVFSFTVRNITDKHYGDVIVPWYTDEMQYPRDGRNFWIQLEYNFR